MSRLELGKERRLSQAASLRVGEMRKSASEQLMHVSGRVPKKARTMLAMINFSGPTASQDAERAEQGRWLGHLATLLVVTQTPLGQRLVQKPAACNRKEMGLSQEHSETVFMCCASISPGSPRLIKSRSRQQRSMLELKVQEPCAPTALKVVHQSLVYLDQAYTSRWPRHHFTQQAWVHFIKSGTKSGRGPADIFFLHHFLRESATLRFLAASTGHIIQSGRRPASICELFAEQGIGYALWFLTASSSQSRSRDQTPPNLHPLVHLPQAVTRACPVDGTLDVLTATTVFFGINAVCPSGARSNTCYLCLGETQERL